MPEPSRRAGMCPIYRVAQNPQSGSAAFLWPQTGKTRNLEGRSRHTGTGSALPSLLSLTCPRVLHPRISVEGSFF